MTTRSDPTAQATSDAVLAALGSHPEATTAELAEALGIGHSTAAKRLVSLERSGTVRRTPGVRDGGRRLPDRWSVAPTEPTGVATTTALVVTPASVRLGRGELARLVLGVLGAHPCESFGPAGVAKTLGRSPGAVANALDRLVTTGVVSVVSATPRRYQVAGPEAGPDARPDDGRVAQTDALDRDDTTVATPQSPASEKNF